MTDGQSPCKCGTLCNVTQPEQAASGRFQPPEVRQRQILDATSKLALEHGLDEVSIAQVAAEAGIAKGSIYLHYSSRNDLIDALRADLWHQMLDKPHMILGDNELNWTERMDQVVHHLVEFSVTNEDLYHAVFHATGTHSDEPWTESRQLISMLLQGGESANEFELVDLDVTTDFLLHAYAGPCYHSDNITHTSRQLQRLFRRVVGADPATG